MPKDFQKWHIIKSQLDNKTQNYLFQEREIWWCSIGENIGFEQDGKNDMYERPILVIKKFNHEMFLGTPLTSTRKVHPLRYPYSLGNIEGDINLSQCRTLSSKRLLRKMTKMGEEGFGDILNLFTNTNSNKAKAPTELGQSRVPYGKKG